MKHDWTIFENMTEVKQKAYIERLVRWSEVFRRIGEEDESLVCRGWANEARNIIKKNKLQNLNRISDDLIPYNNHIEDDPFEEENWDNENKLYYLFRPPNKL